MDVTKMTPEELGEQVQAICSGSLRGEGAAQVLRVAMQFYREGMETLDALKIIINRAADTMLEAPPESNDDIRVGPRGDPINVRTFAQHEIAKVSFSTDDKLLMLSRSVGAIAARLGGGGLKIKMTDASGNYVWIDYSLGSDEFVRWD